MSVQDRFQFEGVYYLESQNPNMNPIAIRPEIAPFNYVGWEDTSNGRIMRYSKLLIDGQEFQNKSKKLPETIEVISHNNELYKLVKLTIPIFNEKLKSRVVGGESLNFHNDQELQDYYLKTDFYSTG